MRRFTDGLRASGIRCLSCRAPGAVAAAALCLTVAFPAHADEPHAGTRCSSAEGTVLRPASLPTVLGAQARPAPGGDSLIAETRIRSAVRPGSYRITDDCGIAGTVTIAGPSATPTAPVRAGGGGTAPVTGSAKSAAERGPGLAQILVGAILAAGAGLAVAGRTARRRTVNSAGK